MKKALFVAVGLVLAAVPARAEELTGREIFSVEMMIRRVEANRLPPEPGNIWIKPENGERVLELGANALRACAKAYDAVDRVGTRGIEDDATADNPAVVARNQNLARVGAVCEKWRGLLSRTVTGYEEFLKRPVAKAKAKLAKKGKKIPPVPVFAPQGLAWAKGISQPALDAWAQVKPVTQGVPLFTVETQPVPIVEWEPEPVVRRATTAPIDEGADPFGIKASRAR